MYEHLKHCCNFLGFATYLIVFIYVQLIILLAKKEKWDYEMQIFGEGSCGDWCPASSPSAYFTSLTAIHFSWICNTSRVIIDKKWAIGAEIGACGLALTFSIFFIFMYNGSRLQDFIFIQIFILIFTWLWFTFKCDFLVPCVVFLLKSKSSGMLVELKLNS